MVEQREYRPTISKVWSRSSVLSFDDALFMNKIKLSMSPVGKSAKGSYVFANLDFDDVLLLADAILNGQFTKLFPHKGETDTDIIGGRFQKYGGSKSSQQYGGRPESRIIEINALMKKADNTPRWKVTIKVGEGIVDSEKGTIKPKDFGNMSTQIFYVTNADMRKIMLRLRLHLETYFARHFEDMYDSKGNLSTDFRDDVFTSTHRSAGGEDRTIHTDPDEPAFEPTSDSSYESSGMVDL